MTLWDGIGYLAAALVLLAFRQKQMVPLRTAAARWIAVDTVYSGKSKSRF